MIIKCFSKQWDIYFNKIPRTYCFKFHES